MNMLQSQPDFEAQVLAAAALQRAELLVAICALTSVGVRTMRG